MTINDLLKITQKYCDPREQVLIKKAYFCAEKIHQGEKRGTGEAYIMHPLMTAKWLAENELDADTISAALLHDVVENNPSESQEIKKIFGAHIAELVDGVTKLGKIKIKKSWFLLFKIFQNQQEKQLGFERHVESLRKMLMAMSKDIRVIFIKFADRLHNMQTLNGVYPQKRERIARETIEIYAPLAYRLGMGELKGTLEDLAFPYAYPKEYEWVKKIAGPKYQEKGKHLEKAMRIIKLKLAENKIKAQIHGRKKHLYSLYKKLIKYDRNLSKIYDLVAIRIIVDSVEACYKVLGIVHSMWKPLLGRIKDYIAMPRPNGYQSLHTTVFGPDGEILEIQIRTWKMHNMAENGIAAHWHYSQDKKSTKIPKDKFEWVQELGRWQGKLIDRNEWSKGLRLDFFEKRIFVFTPQGDIRDLPASATPIDFAYSVHTEIGNKAKLAKVNGKLVRLNHKLSNGDIVDVIIDKNSKGPKRDWLRFVKTSKARGKIKSFFV